MEKLKDLNEIKHKLIDWVKTETVKGFNSPEEVEILGEVVDMIKDIAGAEKSCMEAAYYENVTEAMENYEKDEGEGRMGYDRWRYSSGRFAPKGRGSYGYVPMYTNHPVEEPMGYGRTDPRMDGRTMRTGYTPNTRMGHDMKPTEKLDMTMDTMGEIWADADKDTKKKMKGLVEDLLDQMEQSF